MKIGQIGQKLQSLPLSERCARPQKKKMHGAGEGAQIFAAADYSSEIYGRMRGGGELRAFLRVHPLRSCTHCER
jgi:hypothetical protein